MSAVERRSSREYVDIRVESDGRRFKGFAIVFNSRSLDLGGFVELIAPEAVDRTMNQGLDVHAFHNHNSDHVLGRRGAGTLLLRKEARGLSVDIDPDSSIGYVSDLLKSVARGDVTGMSFGFRTLADTWDFSVEPYVRTVTDMVFSEVSIVPKPAYPATNVDVAMRSIHEFEQQRQGSRIDWLQKVHRTRLAR